MSTSASALSVGQVLNTGAKLLSVPRLQRPYSWTSTECAELWTDLIRFHEQYQGNNVLGKEYFMGSLVGQTTNDSGTPAIDILDGQQRLATLTIVLATIRDLLDDSQLRQDAQHVQTLNIAKYSGLGQPPQYLLRLSGIDEEFFRNRIQVWPRDAGFVAATPKTASQKLIINSYEFFERTIKAYADSSAAQLVDLLRRLHQLVINNLQVILITSDGFEQVADVFERLNDRGKGLSTLDLLRNYQIALAPAQQQDAIDGFWADIFELSDSAAQVGAFLRHVWITYEGDPKSRSLYKEIKAVMDNPQSPQHLRDPYTFSSNLQADTVLYRKLLDADHQDAQATRHLQAIKLMGANALLPPALAAVARLSVSDQVRLFRALISVFVRFNVVTAGESTELEEVVYKVAQEVRAGTSVDDALPLMRPLLRADQHLIDDFKTLVVGRSGTQRYMLQELERYLVLLAKYSPAVPPDPQENAEIIPASSNTLWIEHIYPQSPDAKWGRWTEHDQALNALGNLTLLHNKLNATAKNDAFATKKPTYASSQLRLNEYFAGLTGWSYGDVLQRQATLAQYVPVIWAPF